MKSNDTSFRSWKLLAILVGLVVPLALFGRAAAAPSSAASANSLTQFKAIVGRVLLSEDACGTNTPTPTSSCTVDIAKPSPSATVREADLFCATTGFSRYTPNNGDVTVNGVPVAWDLIIPNAISSFNARDDVTTIVKPVGDAALTGLVTFTITENPTFSYDGCVLKVIWDDPTTTVNSILIFFGAQTTTGDTFVINFAQPLDANAFLQPLQFSLGISFGFQPSGQFSQVDVNGMRLTTSAGGQDDGAGQNGALITAGGTGDTTANPPPFAPPVTPSVPDDELYDLRPFVNVGDTSMTIFTLNPSNDDNIFLANVFLPNVRVVTPGPQADKEVTDLVLDDGSGYPDRQGKSLNCRRDEASRTTRCSLTVEVSTNPIISVVSRDRNNGPDDADTAITFLASIDDGHPPGHVEGAYIPNTGSPRDPNGDLLTCFSVFNPKNPLEQTLNKCPTEEKIPGDGVDSTAESDLHFQLLERAKSQQDILRFFKLHCRVGGQHTITFYNKAEPKAPAQDPNLDNNWWRAILDLTCVTPGKVTGGGYIDPVTGNPVGDAEMLIKEGSIAASIGSKATFGFVIEFKSGDPAPTGNLEYNDHGANVRIKALSYTILFIVGCTAHFEGTADVNGNTESLKVDVFDGGEPGSGVGPDTFKIQTDTYMAAGPLVGGNIQIHNGNPC